MSQYLLATGDLESKWLTSGAVISDDELYRYRLFRRWGWGTEKGTPLWVLLNPSTADYQEDDPTVRRCVGFSKAWGYDSMEIVNLYGWRATDPGELAEVDDPIGPKNDHHLAEALDRKVQVVICAWGTKSPRSERAKAVLQLIEAAGHVPMCLHRTKDGHPGHPLYLRSTLRPIPLKEEKQA